MITFTLHTNAWSRISCLWCILWWFFILSSSQGTLPMLKLQLYRCKWSTGQDLRWLLFPEVTGFSSSPSLEFPLTVLLSVAFSWPLFLVSHTLSFCLFRACQSPVCPPCCLTVCMHCCTNCQVSVSATPEWQLVILLPLKHLLKRCMCHFLTAVRWRETAPNQKTTNRSLLLTDRSWILQKTALTSNDKPPEYARKNSRRKMGTVAITATCCDLGTAFVL